MARFFFKIENTIESPSDSIGWHTAYRRISSRVYCKDMNTLEVKSVYSY